MEFLDLQFYGNTVRQWAAALAITAVVWVSLKLVATVGLTRIAKLTARTDFHLDDVIIAALQTTRGILLVIVAAFFGAGALTLPEGDRAVIATVTIIALLIQGGIWATAAIKRWAELETKRRLAEDAATAMTLNVLGIAARLIVWSLILLLVLDNLGVDVTALVAGLGIGGVAVALAAQSILGDLFASLAIVLDKPFVLGDFLIVGDFMGSVEAIGLKTTRVRSLSGEQVVFGNSDLLNSRVRNYGRMFERRVVFPIGVTYQTPRPLLEKIPGTIKEAVEEHGERVRFDRSHLKSFGSSSIDFETVYFVLTPDYNAHMDIQQAVNLRIHERFEADGIEFAYPTQTLFVVQEPAGQEV